MQIRWVGMCFEIGHEQLRRRFMRKRQQGSPIPLANTEPCHHQALQQPVRAIGKCRGKCVQNLLCGQRDAKRSPDAKDQV